MGGGDGIERLRRIIAMPRGWILKVVIATVAVAGCQSSVGRKECADCTPPKNYNYGYKPICDNFVTRQTAWFCADKALKSLKKQCGKQTIDFQAGFRQAYVDQAMGRPALVPPVPTRHYWNAYYRSCAGQQAAADWFEGYRAGLDYGAEGGVGNFNRVPSSWSLTPGSTTDDAVCAPPEMLPANYQNYAPTESVNPNPAMGPYGPLLNPASYQTPAYAAPAGSPPSDVPPAPRVGRMQLDVF